MRRGDICWALLNEPRGSEPGHRRPVVIVSANAFNDSRIATVLACVVTSNLRLAAAPGNFTIDRQQSGLPRDGVVNVSQVVTIDKQFLDEPSGRLTEAQTRRLDDGLRLVLSL